MHVLRLLVATLALSFAGCRSTPPSESKSEPAGATSSPRAGASTAFELIPMDQHSHAEPNRVRVTHLVLDLELDFDRRIARGSATLSFERRDPTAPLVLDAQGLAIESVRGANGSARPFELGAEHDGIGAPLTIPLMHGDASVRIDYRTTERADALQWLAPEQTSDGRRPFLFTQGQAIYTRTWIPLQDTPGVRVTYEATVRAPRGSTVVMSAEQLGQDAAGAWRFRMQQAIPSYLIALACGELEFRPISERCGVWAEPSVVDGARAELADTESMVLAAEALFGPYRWGRYDLLILPPSFPFGGMENPRLTFATPTILAGDKSLVALVAHELAHSWSGNLVTNATWRDFWLNEGFTVYFEQRIMEQVFGASRSEMEKVLSRAELEREMAELEPWQHVLHVEFGGRVPDDAFSGVPYEKGALLLRRLEQIFGRPRFDQFLRRYFDEHAFESITTEEFVVRCKRELLDADPARARQIDLREWLEQPGLPKDAPRYDSALLERVDRERERWIAGAAASELDAAGWVTQQWLRFLNELPQQVDSARLAELDRAFGFTSSGNSEILCAWLIVAIRNGYAQADDRLERFLMNVGRRKFLKPLYGELAKTPAGLERARSIYRNARPRYHAVAVGTLDKLLKWSS